MAGLAVLNHPLPLLLTMATNAQPTLQDASGSLSALNEKVLAATPDAPTSTSDTHATPAATGFTVKGWLTQRAPDLMTMTAMGRECLLSSC